MKWLKLLLSLFLLSLSVQLFSLSSEEKEKLQEMSKTELIGIVLIYDQTLTEIEVEMTTQELLLKQRETDLNEREKIYKNQMIQLGQSEAALRMREQLLAESFQIQKDLIKAEYWNGFLTGSISGLVLGGIGGGAIGSQFK